MSARRWLPMLLLPASLMRCICATPETVACASDANCPAGYSCASGKCSCAGPQLMCGGRDICPAADPGNCGACGVVCAGRTVCSAGACVPRMLVDAGRPDASTLVDASVDGGGDAGVDDGGADSGCGDVSSSALNCGYCGFACLSPGTCSGGECSCDGGLLACGGTGAFCTDTAISRYDCGVCNDSCAPDEDCSSGVCCTDGGACGPPDWSCAAMLYLWTQHPQFRSRWLTADLAAQARNLGTPTALADFNALVECVGDCASAEDPGGCFAAKTGADGGCRSPEETCQDNGLSCADLVKCLEAHGALWTSPAIFRCANEATAHAQSEWDVITENASHTVVDGNACAGDAGCSETLIDGGPLTAAWQTCMDGG